MAARLITGSSGNGPNGIVENLDRGVFTGENKNTLIRSASNRLDLDIEQDEIDETRDIDNYEDDDFPAARLNYDRWAHTHHMATGYNAPHNSVPECLTGRIRTRDNPLPQQFTQPQNMTTHISPNNTLQMVEQTPQRQNLEDLYNPINRLAEATAGIAFQQQPQTTSFLFKPTTTNILILDGKKRENDLFESLFQTMHKMQLEMPEAMKNYHLPSDLRKEAFQTNKNINASNKRTLEDVFIIFRRKYVRPQSRAKPKHKWLTLTFDHNTKSLSDVLEELNECAERAFGHLAQQMIDSLLYAKLLSHLTVNQLSVFRERHIRSVSRTYDHRKKLELSGWEADGELALP